jgi:hypothetical protein
MHDSVVPQAQPGSDIAPCPALHQDLRSTREKRTVLGRYNTTESARHQTSAQIYALHGCQVCSNNNNNHNKNGHNDNEKHDNYVSCLIYHFLATIILTFNHNYKATLLMTRPSRTNQHRTLSDMMEHQRLSHLSNALFCMTYVHPGTGYVSTNTHNAYFLPGKALSWILDCPWWRLCVHIHVC